MVGKSVEATVRLSAVAQSNWSILDGEHSGKGVDILALPFHRFLNVVQAWAVTRQESAEDAEKFLASLDNPIPGMKRSEAGNSKFDDMSQLNGL